MPADVAAELDEVEAAAAARIAEAAAAAAASAAAAAAAAPAVKQEQQVEGQAEVKAEEGQPPAATAPAAAEEEKKAVSGLLADMTDAAQAGDTEMAEVEQPEAGAGAAAAAAGGTQEQNPVQANVSQQDGELHCLSAHRCCHASLLAVMCTRVSPLPRPSCSAALLPRLMPSHRVPCRPCAALCVCGHLPLGPSRAARVARGAARRLPPVAAGCRRGAGGGGAPGRGAAGFG